MTASEKVVIVDDPFVDWEEGTVQFRLTYEGPLLAETSSGAKQAARAKQKQEIRKKFHPQLRRLWGIHPGLSGNLEGIDDGGYLLLSGPHQPHTIEALSERFHRNGYNFVPMVTRTLGVHCALDILFLRCDAPGAILHRGDIDNRIKTLVDGLKMPTEKSQLGGYDSPDADEMPFFCLLEDDSLITRFTVEADTLLEPLHAQMNENDARVVVTVTLKPYISTTFNYGFG